MKTAVAIIAVGASFAGWAGSELGWFPGQFQRPFDLLLEEYLNGDPEAAIEQFSRWPTAQVESHGGLDAVPPAPRSRAAAALFHTETGLRKNTFGSTRPEVRVINNALSEREAHFRTAFQLVELVFREAATDGDAALLEFCRRWYVQAFHVGRPMVTRAAEERFAGDAEIATLLGAWEQQMMGPEVTGGSSHRLPGLYGNAMLATSHGRFAADNAASAERWFRRAIASDRTYVGARLHLGRLLFTLDRVEEARSELAQAYREAANRQDAFNMYLAALFLGQLHEASGEHEDAAARYRLARSAFPEGQAASLALGRLLVSLGQAKEGWSVARDALESTRNTPGASRDPWHYFNYHGGSLWDRGRHIAEMRELVRR